MKTATLYYVEGNSDKQYTAAVRGGTVTLAWGRRGSTLQTDTRILTPAAAETLYHSKLKEKLAKGYRPGEDAAVLSARPGRPHVQESGGCKAYDRQPDRSYLPMLLNSIGPEHAERLILDPNWFMQQKADGVRAVITVDHIEGTVRAVSRTGNPVRLTVATVDALKHAFPGGAIVDAESCGQTLVIFDILGVGTDDPDGALGSPEGACTEAVARWRGRRRRLQGPQRALLRRAARHRGAGVEVEVHRVGIGGCREASQGRQAIGRDGTERRHAGGACDHSGEAWQAAHRRNRH